MSLARLYWNAVKKESHSSAHMFSYGIFFNTIKQKMVHLWKRLDMCDKKLLNFFAACRFFNYLQIIDFLWLQTWQKLLKVFAMCYILMNTKFEMLWVMKYRYWKSDINIVNLLWYTNELSPTLWIILSICLLFQIE